MKGCPDGFRNCAIEAKNNVEEGEKQFYRVASELSTALDSYRVLSK